MMNRSTRVSRGRRLTALAAATAVVAALLGMGATNPATAASATIDLPEPGVLEAPTPLMVAAGEMAPGLTVYAPDAHPKHFWVDGFTDATRTVSWTVNAPVESEFHVDVLAAGLSGADVVIDVVGGQGTRASSPDSGWVRLDAGTITVPAGVSTITMYRDGGSGSSPMKSIELVSTEAWAGFQERIAQFKTASAPTRSEFSASGLGLMFQYGAWSYPQSGDKPDLEAHTDAFDVEAFADIVESTGAGHVIWSMTWWNYRMQAPIASVDQVVGNGDRTASRDLVGEIATELQSRGIMFMLYYHVGQDEHLGYNSTDFWQAQQFPDTFTPTATGDRSVMFENWKTIVGEIGTRYGDKLDGWFFDDGFVYYPAEFEELAYAARAGNPARLVSWNNTNLPAYTPFQDVVFGEDACTGGAPEGAAASGGDGVLTAGRNEGNLEHCMERMEQDWGVHDPNTTITPRFSSAGQLQCAVAARVQRNAPVSMNLMMHFPGTPSESSLQVLRDLQASLDTPSTRINNDDPGIVYSEGQWAYAGGRPVNDHCGDVSYSLVDGASFEYAFEGTGIDFYGPADGRTFADVYIDGELVQTIDRTDAGYTPQMLFASITGLPAGEHTLRVVKRGGVYLQVDALSVRTEVVPTFALTAAVEATCSGKKVVLKTTASHEAETAAAVTVASSHYGGRTYSPVAPGDVLRHSIKTGQNSVPAGEVTVTAASTVGGAPITVTKVLGYAAKACG